MSKRKEEIPGTKYNHLTIVSFAGNNKYGEATWNCVCDCGNTTVLRGSMIRTGKTKTCGKCNYRYEPVTKALKTHGMTGTRPYFMWHDFKDRCKNPKNPMYPHYGEKGISVCEEWENDFSEFWEWAKENGYKKNLIIDRINNDLGYCPENCRFVTRTVSANNKTSNIVLEYAGEKKTVTQWSRDERINILPKTIYNRIYSGWSAEDALTKPIMKNQYG